MATENRHRRGGRVPKKWVNKQAPLVHKLRQDVYQPHHQLMATYCGMALQRGNSASNLAPSRTEMGIWNRRKNRRHGFTLDAEPVNCPKCQKEMRREAKRPTKAFVEEVIYG